MGPDAALVAQVEAVLDRAAKSTSTSAKPTDADLTPVYNYLSSTFPSSSANASSSSSRSAKQPESHWYCPRADALVRASATYLIFLFAFKRVGTSKTWVDNLEQVCKGCEACARGFSAARRTLARRCLSHFPWQVRANLFAAVDKWQAEYILAEHERSSQSIYGSLSASEETLLCLSASIIQLFFGESSLLADPSLAQLLDKTIARASVSPQSSIAVLGLTPLLIRLLTSPDEARRKWALLQLPGTSRRPLDFREWCAGGVGPEVQALYMEAGEISGTDRWRAVTALVECGGLTSEAFQQGFLLGRTEENGQARSGRGLMAVLSGLLGAQSDDFPAVLDCLTSLLRLHPKHFIWDFDPSPELPHTLFSEIKNNPSFVAMLEEKYPARPEDVAPSLSPNGYPDSDGKGKGREISHDVEGLEWVIDFLLSLAEGPANVAIEDDERGTAPIPAKQETGFGQALAKVTNFCFSEMQHGRLSSELRAAAAKAGLDALCMLQQNIDPTFSFIQAQLSLSLDIHASSITTVALRFEDHPGPFWKAARAAARELLAQIFRADGKDIAESMLGMAAIAMNERKRRTKAKQGKDVRGPVKVDKLHLASIRKDLWSMAYNALSPSDIAGAAMMIKSVATFSLVEKLDRLESWRHDGLDDAISLTEWTNGVRAINSALRGSRDMFPHAMESMALQADPTVVRALWKQPDVPRSAIILLLSPAPETHESMISLIQQSFEDVDDRGDCFRVLLERYPGEAMDGLSHHLSHFIITAQTTPESCSLAKWLVRCFSDILDALCQPSRSSEALLQSSAFLSTYSNDRSMAKRVSTLWDLMTTALAVIFSRTTTWAPYFENEVMIDWMRDALIFGRQMTEHIRAFEAAALAQSAGQGRFDESRLESPVKMTIIGRRMVRKLEDVLRDLVSWFRLTDLETLHQAFELVKTILGRISKSRPDLDQDPELKATLQVLDKFGRKASKGFTSRLSDDLLSELSELLLPFGLDEDYVQFVGEKIRSEDRSSPAEPDKGVRASSVFSSTPDAPKGRMTATSSRNTFEEMMKAARSGSTSTAKSSTPAKSKTTKAAAGSQDAPYEVDDFDDGFLDDLSAGDLDIIEKKAQVTTTRKLPQPVTPAARSAVTKPLAIGKAIIPIQPARIPAAMSRPLIATKIPAKAAVPSRPSGSMFKSQIMRDLRQEFRQERAEHRRQIGGVTRRLPQASALGTGLGAHQPARPVQRAKSISSASDESDNEGGGLAAFMKKQFSPPKKPKMKVIEHKSIKLLQPSMAEEMRLRDQQRANQQAMKARLRPDMSSFWRHVLAWDPQATGAAAPHPQEHLAQLSAMSVLPSTFSDATAYERALLPLFLQELWAQIQKEDGNFPVLQVEVASRAHEDDFLDIDLTLLGPPPERFGLNDSDLVVLRQPGNPKQVFAKVQRYRRLPKGVAMQVRVVRMKDSQELWGKSKWQVLKRASLSTSLREFAALRGLRYYDQRLLSDFLAARTAKMARSLSESEVQEAMRAYDVNEPQARAIVGSAEVEGFYLIQGPPGTGKTKTIGGLVGKWISERNGIIARPGEKPVKAKLLVCAPSNAAIDEVCKRLMNGVPSSCGGQHRPVIVRIGMDSSVNDAVKDISLDNLVEAKILLDVVAKGGGGGEYDRIRQELDDVKDKIREKQDQLKAAQGHEERRKVLEEEVHALFARRSQLGQASSKAKDAARDASRHLDAARRTARDAVLQEADIICATLSGSGQESLAAYTFETVIVDEAAQAIELSCLIPLKYGCRRCIMVGDPNQLPPTTLSDEAGRCHYDESVFVRMTKGHAQVQLLSIQYRMHPYISELPSKVFYNSQLKDGPDMATKTAALWHSRFIFGPYRFFNVDGVETRAGTSTKNGEEAKVAVELYRRLEADFGERINLAMRIGVITMYREQLTEMRRAFNFAFGQEILQRIEFNTVDGFQGQEKDIIILSCVRSGPNLTSIGFLKDRRRMNVALTRAKSSLFIIGNGPTLERSDPGWRTIVGDARERGFFIDYKPDTFAKSIEDEPPPKVKLKKERSSISGPKSPVGLKSLKSPTTATRPRTPTSASKIQPVPGETTALKRKASDAGPGDKKRKQDSNRIANGDPPYSSSAITVNGPNRKPGLDDPGASVSQVEPKSAKSGPISTAPCTGVVPGKGVGPPAISRPMIPRPLPLAGGASKPPGMPAPPRPPEDVLFIKKKKAGRGLRSPELGLR